MSNSDQDITKLKDELKRAYKTIEDLLKQIDTLKEMHRMQTEMIKGLEKIIDRSKPIDTLQTQISGSDLRAETNIAQKWIHGMCNPPTKEALRLREEGLL